MDPIEYQKQLMKSYEEENNKSLQRIQELLSQGFEITLIASTEGPYTIHTTYSMSNGESFKIISASLVLPILSLIV